MASDVQLTVELKPGDVKQAAAQLQAEIEQIFNTSVDEKLQASFVRLQQKMEEAYRSAESIKREMTTLENTKIETPFYTELKKALQDSQAELGKLQEKMNKFRETGGNTNTRTFKNMQYDAQLLEETIEQLKLEMKGMREAGESHTSAVNTEQYQKLTEKLNKVNNQMRQYVAQANQMAKKSEGPKQTTISKWEKLRGAVQKATNVISKFSAASKKLTGGSFGKFSGMFSGLNKGLGTFTKSLNKGFWTVLKYTLGLRSLFIVTNKVRNALKDGIKNLVQYSSTFNKTISNIYSSFNYVKNSLATAFEPIITVVQPILTSLVDSVAEALGKVSHFFSALIGRKTYYKAKKVYQDYAESLRSETDKSKDKVDELKRTISGFDDVEILKGPDKDSDSSGDGNKAKEVTPADMFETLPVEAKFEDLAKKIKDAWAKADFTEIGQMLGTKLRDSLDKINWAPIKKKAEKIASSLATFINGFVETPGLWQTVGKTLAEGANTGLTFADTFLQKIHTDSIGKAITTTISNFFKNIDWSLVGSTVSHAFARFFDFIRGLIEGIDWSNLPFAIIKGIKDFFTGFDWESFSSSLGQLIGAAVKAAIELATSSIKLVVMLGEWIGKQFRERIDKFRKEGEPLGIAIIHGILQGIIDAIKAIAKWIKENIIKPFVDGFKKGFGIASPSKVMKEQGKYIIEGMLQGIKDALLNIFTWVNDNIVQPFLNAFKSLFGLGSGSSTVMKTQGGNIISGLLNGIITALANIGTWIKEHIFQPFIDGFKKIFGIKSPSTVMKEQGRYIIQGMLNGITSGLANIGTWVKEHIFKAFKNALTTAFNIVSGVASNLKSVGTSIISGIKNGANNKKSTLTTTFTSIRNSVWNVFTKTSWKDVGLNLIYGIGDGLSKGWDWLSESVTNVANAMFETAKNALGIKSPSKLFREKIGKMIPAGIALGIDAGADETLASMNDLTDALFSEIPSMIQLPDIVTGEIIPYEVELPNTEDINISLNKLAEMLEYTYDNQITREELEELIIDVIQRYLNIEFYIGDEQIARHANAGNARLDRRFNPVMT